MREVVGVGILSLLPLMGYNLILIRNAPPTLKARRARRLTRLDELVAPRWGRQWPKGGGVIFLTLGIIKAVA